MTGQDYDHDAIDSALGRLGRLPVIPAMEFMETIPDVRTGPKEPTQPDGAQPFADEREYRFCKAVIDNPLRASSGYPKLAGMSSKTAISVRRKLVQMAFIRERTVDSAGRGRSTILLEATPAGSTAVEEYESGREKR